MKNQAELYIFGEVLFDCFPTGEQILGGAPFNVAWHLQALGDQPRFISQVGKDERGDRILQAMRNWGMSSVAVQIDAEHPTGRVEVTITDDEPSYDIVADSAYDFISAEQLREPLAAGILYHGTLCLRNQPSRNALREIAQRADLRIFLDVNLRPPWWQRDEVFGWLKNAHWVKMNQEELRLLGEATIDIRQQMVKLQSTCGLEQLIVTCGEQGTLIRTADGEFHSRVPEKAEQLIDTVGAGDAFSAVYIHGLRAGWPTAVTLHHAQQFASKIVGLRGATTTNAAFYQEFIASLAG
ncbi:MAG: carbohydrate kinase [Desulfuromusa sp.]|jgi:fructokinase|nr:carbohydrate kinase [Desulfuromusa sp.]